MRYCVANRPTDGICQMQVQTRVDVRLTMTFDISIIINRYH